jgi:hypothetical protein
MGTKRERESGALSRRNFLKLAGGAGIAGSFLIADERLHLLRSITQPSPTCTPTETPTPTNTPLPTPTETPKPTSTPEHSPEMLSLKDQLKSEIDNFPGETAIAVTDVLTGEKIDVYGERPQKPGCVANLLCALTAIDGLSEGTATYSKEEIEDTMTTMIRHSDPIQGRNLVEIIGNSDVYAGIAKINNCRQKWAMVGSLYDHPPAYDEYSTPGKTNLIVPNEMNMVLTKLAKGELFAGDWNEYAIWAMKFNKLGLNFMIPWEIPESEATVAHKVGWTPGCNDTINDVGLILANDGRFKIAISCMFQGQECPLQDDLFYGPGVFLSKLAGISYRTFTARYGHP